MRLADKQNGGSTRESTNKDNNRKSNKDNNIKSTTKGSNNKGSTNKGNSNKRDKRTNNKATNGEDDKASKIERIYITSKNPSIKVPMRKITQSKTPHPTHPETNPPLFLYDTSGPYGDPNIKNQCQKRACARAHRLD